MQKPETITLGGRKFVDAQNTTIEHDYWVMSELRAAGLDELHMLEAESYEAFAKRVVFECINQGRVFRLLAGLLVPADAGPEGWTQELATQSSEFFRTLRDAEDKQTLQVQVVSVLTGFLAGGLVSVLSSRASSGRRQESEPGTTPTEAVN